MKPAAAPLADGTCGPGPAAAVSTPEAPCPTANAGLDGRGVLLRGLAGAAAMFFVQPPADLWALAWLAPLPWLAVVRAGRITAAHPWRTLWFAGLLHWLATIHWLRLPHPATAIGWVALSAYLACYVPLFVAVARRLVHGWGWPLAAAAAVAWMACEQLRGWLLGGFTFGGLGHTQWRWTTLIQLADCLGAVGVGGVVMAVSAGLSTAGAEIVRGRLPDPPRRRLRPALAGLVTAAAVLGVALGDGRWRAAEAPRPTGAGLDVLLVQGSIDTELKHDPAAAGDVVRHYDGLTAAALDESGDPPALIAWPETM
ncbi:MAG: hypothetical protein ACKOTB_04725, partial [Planctomycetia bacterium]